MSRIGKQPVPLAQGVKVQIVDNVVTVTGPKGTLSREVVNPNIRITQDDGSLVITRTDDEKEQRPPGRRRQIASSRRRQTHLLGKPSR